MNILRTISIAIQGMLANKLRTTLSSLGIIIGVFSVVVLLAIGEWAQKSILSSIESLGTNLLTISPGGSNDGDVRSFSWSDQDIFMMEHVDLIESTVSGVIVAPVVQTSAQVIYQDANTNTLIYGISSSYEFVRNTTVEQGSFITDVNNLNREKVAVIGPTVAENLFGTANPIGATIRIGNALFTVVGVTKSKWGSGFGDQDDVIYIPITTAMISVVGSSYIGSISVSVEDSEAMNTKKDAIEKVLLRAFNIENASDANFTIQSQEDMLETVGSITEILKWALSGIAAISLLVWGIGVMNILLVTVTERTKEIGIRKAIGAKNRNIIEQFLIESVILTLFWGIIGIGLSYGLVFLVNMLFPVINATITTGHIVLALSFSVGIGLFFGIYPAYKAARMDPIEALRTE